MHLVAGVVYCVWFIRTCMAQSRIKEVSFTLAGALLTFFGRVGCCLLLAYMCVLV